MPVDVSVGCNASPAGLFKPLKVNGLPVKSGYLESYNVVFYKLFYEDVLLWVLHGADSVGVKFYGDAGLS